MGSSNMGVVTTGDVENQQHNPKWFANHKYMLCPNQEGNTNELGYFIMKLPKCDRQPPQAFSPHGWQFGLHNRENLDSSGSEAVKLAIAVRYGLVGEKWDHFCDAIVDDPKAMLACYGLQKGVTNWTNEQIKHVLALDALFLATYIDTKFPIKERRMWLKTLPSWNDGYYAKYKMWMRSIHRDIRQVENQIPLVLIDKVVKYVSTSIASKTFKGNGLHIDDLQYQQRSIEYGVKTLARCFMVTTGEAFKIGNSTPLNGKKTHIFGAAYKVICGSKGLLMERVQRHEYIHIPSATKLDQSRIKIVGVDGPLCTISYKNKCLFLPKMRIFDETISFIRNMAWYEWNTIIRGCVFNDYISLMSDLIQAREDLNLLVKYGVIYNTCGIKGFEMWSTLQEGLTEINSSKIHHDIKEAIVKRCGFRRYRLWSEFKIIICSKPWVVLSTIVVVLVTMATLVQTYIAIIGSNKMKPKFP